MAEDLDRLLEIKPEQIREESIAKRYPALRVISIIFRILAYLSAVSGITGVTFGIFQKQVIERYGGESNGTILLLSLLYGAIAFVTFLTFLAIAEAIHVFIDIEENTRNTSSMLRRLKNLV
ncbi:MAG: hypothetical protein NUV92_03625 [Ignavibacteria bacterium]|jgi:hypothetical protein|nr:hypothetical protein [Ignavibacteria bacterium]MDH7526592.1 hypothetical protein [Ignavibacteria bacterium]